jgi:hypothetical protein
MSDTSSDALWMAPLFIVLVASITFFLAQIAEYTTLLR